MSTQTATPTSETGATPTTEGATPLNSTPKAEPANDLAAEVEKWKALSRKNEEQAKSNAEKAKRLDGIEEANKTELEKAQQVAQEARDALALVQREALVNKVALEQKVPADLIQFLTGADEDALKSQAELLVNRVGPITPAAPQPDPSQGGQGSKAPRTAREAFADMLENLS